MLFSISRRSHFQRDSQELFLGKEAYRLSLLNCLVCPPFERELLAQDDQDNDGLDLEREHPGRAKASVGGAQQACVV